MDKENYIEQIKSMFDFTELCSMRPEDFEMLGVTNPWTYRKKFLRLTGGYQPKERGMIFALCVAMHSRNHIMAAMLKFRNKSWYANVATFVSQ
ncbi:unnamed protein product, partial [Dibothriocephalus latus]